MKRWMAALLFFGGCTSGPQTETSEANIEAQGKAIDKAAEAMVNEAVLQFEVTDAPEREVPKNSKGNLSNIIKPASQ